MTPAMHPELPRLTDINRDAETSVVVRLALATPSPRAATSEQVRRIEENRVGEWYQGIEEARQILRGVLRLEKPLITPSIGHAMGLTRAPSPATSPTCWRTQEADTHVRMGLWRATARAAVCRC